MSVVFALLSGAALSYAALPREIEQEPVRAAIAKSPDDAPGRPTGLVQRDGAAAQPDASEIVITARRHHPPGDPLQSVNIQSFELTQKADAAIVGPAAHFYEHGLPGPIRSGLGNFLKNLHEPVVALNDVVQLHPGRAAGTVGRFLINSTAGVGGLIDVAKRRPFNLPRRRNGFANTLGFYGVAPGPFFFLPFVGPTTARDLLGDFVDRSLLPIAIGGPFRRPAFTIPAAVLGTLDRRLELDHALADVRNQPDPYTARRDFYLERRRAEIEALHKSVRVTPTAAPSSVDRSGNADRAQRRPDPRTWTSTISFP